MASGPAAVLRREVLPLFRTRLDVSRWSNVGLYAEDARRGLGQLEDVAVDDGAAVVVPVLRDAITAATRVYGRARDGYGEIQLLVQDLLAVHARLCREAPDPGLLDWLMGFEFDPGAWQDFSVDPVQYADALGVDGLAEYEVRLLQLLEQAPPEGDAEHQRAAYQAGLADPERRARDLWDAHVRFAAARSLGRVAVARRDPGLVIARHAGGGTEPHRLLATAQALVEIDAVEEAIDYAGRAAFTGTGVPATRAGELWVRLLATHHPARELDARAELFARFPNSSTAAALHRVAAREGRWKQFEDQVLARLEGKPRDQVLFLLHTLHDHDRAFTAAMTLQMPFTEWNDQVWDELITARVTADPGSVLPVLEQQVESMLLTADATRYRAAAVRLQRYRDVAAAAGTPERAVALVERLRAEHRRRPRLQAELDRAGL